MVLALAEDNLALQTYAIGFWKPLPTQSKSYEPLFYHIQVPSMSIFYPDFIQILSRFYPDFIQILSRSFKSSLYPDFILIFENNLNKIWIKSG